MTEEKKNGELVPTERTLSQRIADAESGIEAINRLRNVALKLLKPRSVIDQAGHPYIKSNAASLIGRMFGVSVIDQKWEPTEIIQHTDGYPDEKIFTVSGTCIFDGQPFPVCGVSTTRDKFFGKKTVDGKKVFKQYDEIDIGSLKMKAVTRMNGAATRAALDLNSLEWAEIKESAKIDKSDVEAVEYGGESGKKQELSNVGKEALKEIKELLNYCFLGVAKDAKTWLFKETTFDVTNKDTGETRTINGKQDPNKLTEKQIPHILTKLKKMKTEMVEAEINPPEAKQ
jgi:hypothetical protein